MFITSQEEFDAAFEQLQEYPLIESPTDAQKRQYSELAAYMDMWIVSLPAERITIH